MKILIYADLMPEYREDLVRQLPQDAEITFKDQLSASELKESLQSAEILIGNPPAEMLTDIPSSLKF